MKLYSTILFFIFFIVISNNTYTMQEPSYYEVLGVPITATKEEIDKAYRQLSRQWHPDRPTGEKIQFQKISEAHTTLTDETKRKEYNDTLKTKKPTTQPQQPSPQQTKAQKAVANKLRAAKGENNIHEKSKIAKEIVSIIDANNITDDKKITKKALALLYKIATQHLKNRQYKDAIELITLGLEKAIAWKNKTQKREFEDLKKKYEEKVASKQKEAAKKEELDKIEKEKKEKEESYNAQTVAMRHISAFTSAQQANDKEKHIKDALDAIRNHKFIQAILKEAILKSLLKLTQQYSQEKNQEKQGEYAQLGFAKAQEFGFEGYEQQFKEFLPQKSGKMYSEISLKQALENLYNSLTDLAENLAFI